MGNFYKSYKDAFDLHFPTSQLGTPTSPMVEKQLEEFGKRLNSGVKNIEIGTISADKFEGIPSQHFDEIRRLAKITNSKASVHAPLLDLAGFSNSEGGGGRWREEQRASTEQQVFSILERSHQLTNGEIVPVVFHAGSAFSQEYGVPYDKEKNPNGLKKEVYERENGEIVFDKETGKPKTKIEGTEYRALGIVNRETGELTRIDHEIKKRLGGTEDIFDPEKRLHSMNSTQWDKEKVKLLEYQKNIEEIKEKMNLKARQNDAIDKTHLAADETGNYKKIFEENNLDITRMGRHINELNRDLRSEMENIYNKFEKFASKEEREDSKKALEEMQKNFKTKQDEIEKIGNEHRQIRTKIYELGPENRDQEVTEELYNKLREKEKLQSQLTQAQAKQVVTDIAGLEAPQIWVPVKDFAIEETAKTVAGAIARMYAKLKEEGKEKETPFIAMENFFVHSPMSRAKELREAVLKGREKLAEKLSKECNLSLDKAKEEAERLIAATWDVGHINNLRKSGYEGEELRKLVIEETKQVADVVKHVHITDNFGFFDSHLPPGMGNVPIAEMMAELKKTWEQLEKEGRLHQTPRGIVEAGGFVANIGQDPQINVLEYFGSPLYKMGQSPYFGGGVEKSTGFAYSPYRESFVEFPQQHFSLYGSSFTTLPKTLGGQVGNESSRFSGTPNQ